MTLGNLRTLARLYNPGAKINAVSNAALDLILNSGAKDVASKSICLPTSTKFNTVADQAEYNLTSVLSQFLVIDKPGLWYRESSTSEYTRLDPVTIKWLDDNRPGWRDEDASDPTLYYQDGNILGLVPAPDTAIVKGLWLYYGQAPVAMVGTSHYPFGYGSEISRLIPLHEAVLAYASWKLTKAMNEGQDAYRLGENEYKRTLAEKMAEVGRRIDISSDRYTKFQGRKSYR